MIICFGVSATGVNSKDFIDSLFIANSFEDGLELSRGVRYKTVGGISYYKIDTEKAEYSDALYKVTMERYIKRYYQLQRDIKIDQII